MTKRVLVTGATRGIGLEIARTLAERDFSLIVTASTPQSLAELARTDWVTQGKAVAALLDLSSTGSIDAFVDSHRDGLWAIVNNAGICKTLNLSDPGDDPFDEVMATNLNGPYRLTRKLLGQLMRPGRIVNISSQLGKEGRAGYAAYCASKSGLIAMTKCWAKELGREGVTVNAVCPGWVDTEMSRIDMKRMADEEGVDVDEFYRRICEPLELKRFNTTREVANLVAFLISPEAAGITGRDWLMQTIWNQQ